jgi:hypothetical protein
MPGRRISAAPALEDIAIREFSGDLYLKERVVR